MQKKTLAAISLIVVLAFSIGFLVNPLTRHFNPKVNVDLYIQHSTGQTATVQVGNVITDIGENYIRDILGFDNVTGNNATKWISLSNDGSASSSWTELPNEVAANNFTRVEGTVAAWLNSGDYAYNVTYTFTATGSQQLQTAGLQWNDTPQSDENLFAAADFTQTTFEADDTLTVTWVITVNAN